MTKTHDEHLALRRGCHASIPGLKPSYGYTPSLAAGIVFCIIFGICMSGHLVQSVRFRKATSILLAIGAMTEVIGWAGRLWSSQCPYNEDAFLMQITTLIIAPNFFTACAYIVLGRLIKIFGRASSFLSAKMYLYIFIACDLASLVIQAVGGATASQASDKDEDTAPGTHIMVGGIVFQLVCMIVFLLFFVDFLRRTHSRFDEHESGTGLGSLKLLIAAVFLSVITVFIRSVYRTIELVQGWEGFLITHERYFIALDAAMMVIAVGVYNLVDPAVVLRGTDEDGVGEKSGVIASSADASVINS